MTIAGSRTGLQAPQPPRPHLSAEERTLVVVGFAFPQVGDKEFEFLKAVRLDDQQGLIDAVLNDSAIRECCVVDKCNALLMVASCPTGQEEQSIERMFYFWNDRTNHQISPRLEDLVCRTGGEALQYILETSVGLHSVALGDVQVFAQVNTPLKKAINRKDLDSQFSKGTLCEKGGRG